MLTTALITSIIPNDNLQDIDTESENDLSIFLNWIAFKPPLADPSPRIKASIRQILKTANFNQFLYNSIHVNFPVIPVTTFIETMEMIQSIESFYQSLSKHLNIDLRSIINHHFRLVFDSPKFQTLLLSFLSENVLENDIVPILMIFDTIGLINDIMKLIITVIIDKIKSFVNYNCHDFSKFVIKNINQWIKTKLYPNFKKMLKFLNPNLNYYNNLVQISYNELISLRINQIFTMIKSYPKSEPGLMELYKCLNYKNYELETHSQRDKLVTNFNYYSQIELLNSGINTVNLIKIYIKIIKSFLIIDPKGVLLDKVIRPLRIYLKTRDDIIQKLVTGLIDDSDTNELSELYTELSRSEKKTLKIDEFHDLNWVPDPIDALPDFKTKISDIIESLISIFDSKEIFISEFTKIFGNKLINRSNSQDLNKILKLINLLKLRFGKNEFFNLDIMIQDIVNSTSKLTVLSHLYWPDVVTTNNNQANPRIHPYLVENFEIFNQSYRAKNANRYLKLIPNFTKLTIKINDQHFNVEINKASVIMMFRDFEELTIEKIVDYLALSEFDVREILRFWVSNGVLLEINGVYVSND